MWYTTNLTKLSLISILYKSGRSTRNIYIFTDQIAVHSRYKIIGIEVDILDAAIELGRDVVAQPFRIHTDVEVAQRADAGAARFGHFFSANLDEAVHVDVVWHF